VTRLIGREELRAAIAEGAVTVVDALPEQYYAQAHLPGAINLVEADVPTKAAELLPARAAAVVTYCSNESCGNSQAVASLLEQRGYTNVRKYREGIQGWVAAGLPTESGLASGSGVGAVSAA
jgi:rhodanese-related sulfurtransferase